MFITNLPYKTKIALLTLIPLIIAITAISLFTMKQNEQLATTQANVFESELINSKKAELKNYLELAYSAIKSVYENPDIHTQQAKWEAYNILKNMEFGEDGYFFVYDYDGVSIVHPRKPELEGQNLFNFQDDDGKFLIKELIGNAKEEGGYTYYLWDKPSGGKSVEKLGYSIGLDKWQWMVGTGLYIDDIQKGVAGINAKAKDTSSNTLLLSSLIAIGAILLTALTGFIINLSESKLANQKMRDLTHKTVNFQEDERKRVSRELHDGLNQLLVSVSYKLDSAKSKLFKQEQTEKTQNISNVITEANDILSSSMQEVRRISRDLRPTLLDDLGLTAAIESLTNSFNERTNIDITVENKYKSTRLPQEIETAFYRIIQEAMTNIEKHASSAKHVTLKLEKKRNNITLSISNDGVGFDKATIDITNPERGLGIRNMQDRAELLEGNMNVNSSLDKGTTVVVNIPL